MRQDIAMKGKTVLITGAGGGIGRETVRGLAGMGASVVMTGDHERAGRCVSRLLYIAARRRWREAKALVGNHLARVPGEPHERTPPTALSSAAGAGATPQPLLNQPSFLEQGTQRENQ